MASTMSTPAICPDVSVRPNTPVVHHAERSSSSGRASRSSPTTCGMVAVISAGLPSRVAGDTNLHPAKSVNCVYYLSINRYGDGRACPV